MDATRIAIFGIAGFSGRHFERMAAALPADVQFHGLGRDLARAVHSGRVTYHEGDAADGKVVQAFLETVRPTHVINLTGKFRGDFAALLSANVETSRQICEALLRLQHKVEKIVLIGSAAEYGLNAPNPVREDAALEPVSPYGLTKVYQTVLAQYYRRNFGIPIVLARTFNIFGEGLSADLSIGSFMKQIAAAKDGGVIRGGNISTSRDFLDIEEISRRYWTLLMQGVAGETYNICAGRPTTIRSMLEDLIRVSGKAVTIETDPALFKDNDVACIYGDGTRYQALLNDHQ